jgi:hypothetical protein
MSHNMVSSYTLSDDTMIVGINNVDVTGNIAINEFAARPDNIGADALDFVVYRFLADSSMPSSMVIQRFTPNWINTDRLQFLAGVGSVFFNNTVGFIVPGTSKQLTAANITQPAIMSLFQSALVRSQNLLNEQ